MVFEKGCCIRGLVLSGGGPSVGVNLDPRGRQLGAWILELRAPEEFFERTVVQKDLDPRKVELAQGGSQSGLGASVAVGGDQIDAEWQ